MTTMHALPIPTGATGSVFAGVDVCREAGLTLPEGPRRPVFDDDLWDLADVVGLPFSLALQHRRFTFALIPDGGWSQRNWSWPCSLRTTRRWPRSRGPTGPRSM